MPTGITTPADKFERTLVALLSHEVRAQRKDKSQRQVAKEAGISSQALSAILLGNRKLTVTQCERVCRVLGIDMLDLMARAVAASSTGSKDSPSGGPSVGADRQSVPSVGGVGSDAGVEGYDVGAFVDVDEPEHSAEVSRDNVRQD